MDHSFKSPKEEPTKVENKGCIIRSRRKQQPSPSLTKLHRKRTLKVLASLSY